jgi:hypothetical protein
MKVFKKFGFTIFIEKYFTPSIDVGIYFYKYAFEINFRLIWIDAYLLIGIIKK